MRNPTLGVALSLGHSIVLPVMDRYKEGDFLFIGIAQPYTGHGKERESRYMGSLLRPHEKEQLARMISSGTQSMPLVIDHGNLSGYGAEVTDDIRLGYATDSMVDDDYGVIVMGYISSSRPEAEYIVKSIQQGKNWGLSFYTEHLLDETTYRSYEIQITHLGITLNPAWAEENSWIYEWSKDPVAIRHYARSVYMQRPGIYIPDETRNRLNWTKESDDIEIHRRRQLRAMGLPATAGGSPPSLRPLLANDPLQRILIDDNHVAEVKENLRKGIGMATTSHPKEHHIEQRLSLIRSVAPATGYGTTSEQIIPSPNMDPAASQAPPAAAAPTPVPEVPPPVAVQPPAAATTAPPQQQPQQPQQPPTQPSDAKEIVPEKAAAPAPPPPEQQQQQQTLVPPTSTTRVPEGMGPSVLADAEALLKLSDTVERLQRAQKLQLDLVDFQKQGRFSLADTCGDNSPVAKAQKIINETMTRLKEVPVKHFVQAAREWGFTEDEISASAGAFEMEPSLASRLICKHVQANAIKDMSDQKRHEELYLKMDAIFQGQESLKRRNDELMTELKGANDRLVAYEKKFRVGDTTPIATPTPPTPSPPQQQQQQQQLPQHLLPPGTPLPVFQQTIPLTPAAVGASSSQAGSSMQDAIALTYGRYMANKDEFMRMLATGREMYRSERPTDYSHVYTMQDPSQFTHIVDYRR